MTSLAWLVIALPLAAAAVGWVVHRASHALTAATAVVGTLAAAAMAIAVAVAAHPAEVATRSTTWLRVGDWTTVLGTRVDGLSSTVAVMVTLVALAVQVYSTSYLHDDADYGVFASQVSLFTAAMLTVVLSPDLVQAMVGWEVMGLCSYLLIGHLRHLPEAAPAAQKAFLVTRLGDVGFVLGVVLLSFTYGSSQLTVVLGETAPPPGGSVPSHAMLTAAMLLLLGGIAGKSAQAPLHVWLPDAMAGPTPVSALIHAATMVAAGVYMVARLYPLFLAAPAALALLAVLAVITMLLASFSALAQTDIKRVLAYSTVSQLSIMAAGLAVGGWAGGMFHLLSHAAFKALLFLTAGAVIHAVGSNEMDQMGGLRKAMPVTFVTGTCGLAALAGLPPFSGFFSKDAVLDSAWAVAVKGEHGAIGRGLTWLVLLALLLTVLLTAVYTTRLWLRTFFGDLRGDAHVHEAPPAMSGVLVALAVPTVAFGFLGLGTPSWIATRLGAGAPPPAGVTLPEAYAATTLTVPVSTIATGLALVGLLAVVAVWRRDTAADPADLLAAPVRRTFLAAFGVDSLYARAIVRPFLALAGLVGRFDVGVISAAVAGIAATAVGAGGRVRRLDTGNAQAYAAAVIVGALVLAVGVAVWR